MSVKTSLPANHQAHWAAQAQAQRLALCLSAALLLGACASPVESVTTVVPDNVEPPKPIATAVVHPPEMAPPSSGDRNAIAARDTAAPAPATLPSVMGYADRLRGMSNNELARELSALGEPGAVPALQLQAALVLIHLHQSAATARALVLLQRVVAHPSPDSAPFKPLARLLVTSLIDQRRLEDAVDRQAQQLRDSQRKIEMLSDRLDAMRDIERSLTPRAPTPGAGRAPSP